MPPRVRREIGDRGRIQAKRRRLEAGGDQRHQTVLGEQRAVAAAAQMVPAAGIVELPAGARRDDDVSRRGALEHPRDALERVRVALRIEQVAIALQKPAVAAWVGLTVRVAAEAKLA